MPEETICALATATGGALGIIRISGPRARSIVGSVCRCVSATTPANSVHYTHITDGPEIIDEAIVTVFRAPHSYTGEDSVEISCHGSQYILNKVLELLVGKGCRMAHPGEFTQRAYLNGKLDLSQAEAVADLIASTNRATHQLAMSQLRGGITNRLSLLREHLLKLTSLLELELDFSDHEDLEFADRSELLSLAQEIEGHIHKLAQSFETGQALKQGIPVAIVGKTNVGKSTLLNQLLKDDRAIVSDIHGTTRDTIEDTININGVAYRFIDTAGIRQTSDTIEQIGINRTYQAIDRARIVLWLLDEAPTEAEQQDMQTRCENKSLIIVVNKIDQGVAVASDSALAFPVGTDLQFPAGTDPRFFIPHSSLVKISAKYGQGINALERAIYEASNLPEINESDVIITNARHYDALLRAHDSILRVISGLNDSLPGDLLAEDLHQALDTLAEITGGQITPQETLNNIFSHFCVGK